VSDERCIGAVVVYESFFGNTESIARAVAGGLRLEGLTAEALDVADAGDVDLDDYDLLVVGGPTHAFALSRPSTRDDAVARGGDPGYSSRGLREWLSELPTRDGTRLAAAFDTRVSKVRHLPMSAARSAAHILREHHFTLLDRPTGFVVQDVEGPLEQREMERAIAWARSLAREAQAVIQARELRPH
jgi:Flavodoxin